MTPHTDRTFLAARRAFATPFTLGAALWLCAGTAAAQDGGLPTGDGTLADDCEAMSPTGEASGTRESIPGISGQTVTVRLRLCEPKDDRVLGVDDLRKSGDDARVRVEWRLVADGPVGDLEYNLTTFLGDSEDSPEDLTIDNVSPSESRRSFFIRFDQMLDPANLPDPNVEDSLPDVTVDVDFDVSLVFEVADESDVDGLNTNLRGEFAISIDTRPPGRPAINAPEPGERRMRLSWSPSSADGDVDAFIIYYRACGDADADCDTGELADQPDGGDGGVDAGVDGGDGGMDAGTDGGMDAGTDGGDGGTDAGPMETGDSMVIEPVDDRCGRALGVRTKTVDDAAERNTDVEGLKAECRYAFWIRTRDEAGNLSEPSEVVEENTIAIDDFFEFYRRAGGEESGGFCFVASAAYGDPQHPHVNILRRFRDLYLLSNLPGQAFVRLYYTYGRSAAAVIEHYGLTGVTRAVLLPIVGFAFAANTSPAGLSAGIVLALAAALQLRRRRRETQEVTL